VKVCGTYKKIGTGVHSVILTEEMIAAMKKCMWGDHKYFKDIIHIMINSVQNNTLDEMYKKQVWN